MRAKSRSTSFEDLIAIPAIILSMAAVFSALNSAIGCSVWAGMRTATTNAANAIVMHPRCDVTLVIDCLPSTSPSPTDLRLVPRCPAEEPTASATARQQDMRNFHPRLQSKHPDQDCVNHHA